MTDEAWNAGSARSLGVLMVGNALDEVDERGRQLRGDTLLVLYNAHHEDVPFALPNVSAHTAWVRVLDTIAPSVYEQRFTGGDTYPLRGRTLAVFVLSASGRTQGAPAAGVRRA
jgi:isoamylase